MRLHVWKKAAAILLFMSCALIARTLLAEGCPPCYSNYPVMQPNAGNGWTQYGQRIVRVGIDSSWDSAPGQTDTMVWNAVNQAAQKWNDARGTGNLTGPYHFQVAQSCLPNNCDIKVVKLATERPEDCLHIEGQWSPDGSNAQWTLRLPQSTRDSSGEAGLAAGVAHEYGHPQGLVNVIDGAIYCGGTPSATQSGFSIMGSALPGCAGAYTDSVQAKDIDAANHKLGSGEAFGSSDCHYYGRSDGLPVDCTDPCADPACPDFHPVLCANEEQSYLDIVPEYEGGELCWGTYLVTEYYRCDGNGCTYLYSTWDLISIECNAY